MCSTSSTIETASSSLFFEGIGLNVRTLEDARAEFAAGVRSDEDLVWDRGWLETDDWWIVFYNSRDFYETGNPLRGLAGNGPFVAPKDGGATFFLRTNTSVEAQLGELGQRIIAGSEEDPG
jgi:hypothetical protein